CMYENDIYEDILKINITKSISLLKKSAKIGNSQAMLNLGDKYLKGSKDIERNLKKALKWYQRSANLGNVTAIFSACRILQNGGDGIEPNPSKLLKLFENAANQRIIPMMSNLG